MRRMLSTFVLVLALTPLAHAQDAMQARIDTLRASLGSDLGQERITARGGRVHDFQTGSIYWSPGTGTRLVTSLALPKYRELGAEEGALGYPVGDEQWGLSGMTQIFEHGFLTTTSTGDVEAEIIKMAIERYSGRMSEVARRLGIGRSTLYRKLKEYGLEAGEVEANDDGDDAAQEAAGG